MTARRRRRRLGGGAGGSAKGEGGSGTGGDSGIALEPATGARSGDADGPGVVRGSTAGGSAAAGAGLDGRRGRPWGQPGARTLGWRCRRRAGRLSGRRGWRGRRAVGGGARRRRRPRPPAPEPAAAPAGRWAGAGFPGSPAPGPDPGGPASGGCEPIGGGGGGGVVISQGSPGAGPRVVRIFRPRSWRHRLADRSPAWPGRHGSSQLLGGRDAPQVRFGRKLSR